MTVFEKLSIRSQLKCELCAGENLLDVYEIPPMRKADEMTAILACQTCIEQIENPELIKAEHWRCLNKSMWSEFAPVQVMVYRLLNLLREELWARELLEQLYLDESLVGFAMAGLPTEKEKEGEVAIVTFDSNGTRLNEGDSVTLIKDLDVKGANFTAKRGTLVKNIALTNNPKHVEGKVNGIQIVLVAAYLKKV